MSNNLAWNGTNYTTINGIPAQQNEIAAPLWEAFFRIQKQRYRAVEIGTGTGGFTRHIARFVEHIITFDTVDRRAVDPNQKLDFSRPDGQCPINWQIADVIAMQKWVAASIKGSDPLVQPYAELPVVLFIDGGNKPLEMKTFAPYLRKGDVIAVHDYRPRDASDDWYYWGWAEIGQNDVLKSLGIPQSYDSRVGAKLSIIYDMHEWRREDLPFVYAAWSVWHKIL